MTDTQDPGPQPDAAVVEVDLGPPDDEDLGLDLDEPGQPDPPDELAPVPDPMVDPALEPED